jgi:nicotinamide mononucleotide (NMN) deamidase PncC
MKKIIHELLKTLRSIELPVMTAESCTSGLLASTLSSDPQAPTMLLGGVTSYCPLIKHRILGVDKAILDEEHGGPGEVSKECALAMAKGAVRNGGLLDPSDCKDLKEGALKEKGQGMGISTTGFLDSGPEGRVGEVWIGLYWVFNEKEGSRVEQLQLKDSRLKNYDKDEAGSEESMKLREDLKQKVVEKAVNMAMDVATELSNQSDGKRSVEKGQFKLVPN